MNVKLLRKIQENILKKPAKFDMKDWMVPSKSAHKPVCGTTCCIGGWAMVEHGWKIGFSGKDEDGDPIVSFFKNGKPIPSADGETVAAKLLNLDTNQKTKLFYAHSWPEPFRKLNDSDIPSVRAANAVARIEHFINTGE